jgi:NCS1 family nucleobase:cation symporter-1
MASEQITRLESSTIQPIPLDQRHGNARDLFTVWFGSNIMLLTIITGALSATVFKLNFLWSVVGLIIGNMVGAIFMALHAAQGPTLGVPQMVQTRGQFGSLGSLLVVGIVIVMYVGFLSSNLVLSGEALASLRSGWSETPGIAVGCLERGRGHLRLRSHPRLYALDELCVGRRIIAGLRVDRLGARIAGGFLRPQRF